MTTKEAKQRLERIWKYYTSAYDIISEDDVTAFEMAINALGAIDQIQWERDMAIKQLHTMDEFMYGQNIGNPEDGSL